MKALNTHPYRFRPPRSRATCGMIVITASASAAMNVVVSTSPVVRLRRWGAHRPSAGDGVAAGETSEPRIEDTICAFRRRSGGRRQARDERGAFARHARARDEQAEASPLAAL